MKQSEFGSLLRSREKRASRRIAVLTASLAAALALSGCTLLPSKDRTLEAPLIQPLQDNIQTVKASRDTIETFLRGNANFVSTRVKALSYKDAGGRLKTMHAEIGQQVEAGELLAELETDEVDYQITLQRLNVERAQLHYRDAMRAEADELTMLQRKMDLERELQALQTLESRLESFRLVAPFDGIVAAIGPFKPGDQVYPYQLVATVADPSRLQLVYSANQPSDLMAIEVGMPVMIQYKGAAHEGKVLQAPSSVPLRTDPQKAGQNATRMIIGLSEPIDAVLGHSADFSISLQRRENAVILPRSAIRSFMGRNFVQVMDGDRRKEIDIEAGLVSGTQIEIVKGVEEDQEVVLGN